MGVLDDVIAESSEKSVEDSYELSPYVTDIMRNTYKLCKENLEFLYHVDKSDDVSYWKRVLHWETLQSIIERCDLNNVNLVEEICIRFRSPKKWELDVKNLDHELSGSCSYANFGTLYSGEWGVYLIDENGKRIILEQALPRM